MATTEHHGAFAFLTFFLIHALFIDIIIPGWAVFLIIFFGVFPDLDTLYWFFKKKGRLSMEFQHHLYFWTHWPLSYAPLIVIFLISLIFNFYPVYFLIPVIGVYCGHLIPDSIATGDGIMWGKIPWKKDRYARYVNLLASKTDGYHGRYWDVRYRKTIFFKLGHTAAISSLIIIICFLIFKGISFSNTASYILLIAFFIGTIILSLKSLPEKYYQEPPEGRYADYRRNPKYINGLSEKNRKKHLEKYSTLLEKKGIMEKITLK